MAGKVSTAKGLFLKFEAAPLWAPLTGMAPKKRGFAMLWDTLWPHSGARGASSRSGSVRWTQSLAEEK